MQPYPLLAYPLTVGKLHASSILFCLVSISTWLTVVFQPSPVKGSFHTLRNHQCHCLGSREEPAAAPYAYGSALIAGAVASVAPVAAPDFAMFCPDYH